MTNDWPLNLSLLDCKKFFTIKSMLIIKEVKKSNIKISLLNNLKRSHSTTRIIELKKLIKQKEFENYELAPIELIAIVALLPKQDHFEALELIKKNFDIQLSCFEIEKLQRHLLSKDLSRLKRLKFSTLNFEKILVAITQCSPNRRLEKIESLAKQYQLNLSNTDSKEIKKLFSLFSEKDLGKLASIPALRNHVFSMGFKRNVKRPTFIQERVKEPLAHQLKTYPFNTLVIDSFQAFLNEFLLSNENDQINFLKQNNSELSYLKMSGNIMRLFRWIPEKSALNYLKLDNIILAIDRVTFSWSDIKNLVGADQRTIYLLIKYLAEKNKLSRAITNLAQLMLLLKMLPPEVRFEFLNLTKMVSILKSKTLSMNMQDLKNFTEVFLPNDYLKFIQSSWIRNRIDHLELSNCRLSRNDYMDILSYFSCEQDQQQVIKLLHPIRPMGSAKLPIGLFKGELQKKHTNKLPDIISGHLMSRAR